MDPLILARWQFGVTTVYHFIFVPLTIGLALFIAILESAWMRTKNPAYLRLTKFFGKLFLINFAIGVVTGIVQEFQFGMNWSSYSRFVGDVFGAPLAMEALLAFFIESTFLGLWIFGWDKLKPSIHLACAWMIAFGTAASAYFILAANSFMQHPVGIVIDEQTGRPKLDSIGDVLFQKLAVVTFSHVITAAIATGAVLLVGVSAYFLSRKLHVEMFRKTVRLGLWGLLLASFGVFFTGDLQGKVMFEVQPMKMAAAEGLYYTTDNAPFSLLTIGTLDGSREVFKIEIPGLLSFLGTGSFDTTVQGINDLQTEYEARFGPGDYKPNIPVTYWNFRLMVTGGLLSLGIAVVGLWLTRRGRLPEKRWVWRLAMIGVAAPFVANATGWIFTEMGRQPWTVYGLYKTEDSVSPTVSGGSVLTSLIVFTVLYGVLAIIEFGLMFKYIKAGPPTEEEALAQLGKHAPDWQPPDDDVDDHDRPLTFAY